MANGINNKYEYRSGLLDSLNVQHTASDVRNEDEYRKKVLNGLGVEYTEDDINQKNLYRAKVVEGLASSGGGGSWQTVFEGSVTTESESTFASGDIVGLSSLDGDSVKVTFNGVEYTLPKHELGYGEMGEGNIPDFSNYPLFIETGDTPYLLYTQTAGTYSLKIEEQQSGGSSDFSTAEVTISTNSGSIGVYLPNADEEVGAVSGVLANTTPKVFTAILYKGHANVTVGGEDFRITSVGGNATLTDGVVDVTGDCTIGITRAGH